MSNTLPAKIKKMDGEFKAALPDHIASERFTRNAITAINSDPNLLQENVDHESVMKCLMTAAQQGLLVDGREAAIVTYNNNKTGMKEATYIPMTEGIMKLVRNSGDVSVISIHVVKENDVFDYELGDNERLTHKPALKERGATIGAYSIVKLKDGGISREWMDVDQINAIRDRKKFVNPVWKSDYDEMARKTVFRRHAKRLPKSTDLENILEAEDARDNGDFERVSRNVEPEAPTEKPEKKQTAAQKAVKAKAETPEHDEDGVIDADFTELPV